MVRFDSNKSRGFARVAVAALALAVAMVIGACSGQSSEAGGATKPSKIRVDYATYNPASLILKEKGWLEEAFAAEGIEIEWVLSQGSNRALSFLQGDVVDFGSTAGAAALISAANGNPIISIYRYSKPEWTALVAPAGSSITKIEDLKGKKVAATIGTDPYIFLLRSLASVGLTESDIELVPLQHADGATALESGQVDAWSGLDPHMARVQLESGAKLFFRDIELNTYGVLNVTKSFAAAYPSYVEKVLQIYERARLYVAANFDESVRVLADEAQIKPDVARLQLTERTDLSSPYLDNAVIESLVEAGKVLLAGGHIPAGTNVEQVVRDLVDTETARKALN